jgi:hypothetical protein
MSHKRHLLDTGRSINKRQAAVAENQPVAGR